MFIFVALEIHTKNFTLEEDTVIIRGYNVTFMTYITINNNNDTFSVSALTGDRTNFEVINFIPNNTQHEPRIISSDFSADLLQLQRSLEPGESLTLTANVTVLVPREHCTSYTDICAEVKPALNASYSQPEGYVGNVMCINVTKYLNCEGKCPA